MLAVIQEGRVLFLGEKETKPDEEERSSV